ncbi:MAG TPA: GNAT family N-acetyltransferase [Deltaproteobacteria bacterium]|jgi:predicted N-acyltransferase|nr:MAG: N-acetyltransferase [Pseudomonadota bacterium]HBM53939.1 GNAT family N-acetyltransferase [Deltaproteobacteria bacterium]
MWFRSKTDVSSTALQTDSNLHQQVFHSLREVAPESWNRLIGDAFPFAEYDYLLALEEGHCVGIEPGWEPRYLTLWEGKQLQAACYLYRKTNSNGEYIFDWDWANAYQRYGQRYFPKLTSAVPFTPATGPKLLVSADASNPREFQQQLLASALELVQQEGCSSLHFLFIPAEECEIYEAAGLLLRHSFQFHWQNQGYDSFEDFLSRLRSKRRKEILRERRQVQEQGLEVILLRGEEVEPKLCRVMYDFYLTTIDRKWAMPYLSYEFFQYIFTHFRDQLVLALARKQGRWVAGTINYHKGPHLFGRYWGCRQDFRSLHFELCYYRLIEYAIEQGVQRFEAGAQGAHKIQRGFLPNLTYSAHWIAHPAFHRAIGEFIEEEKRSIQSNIEDNPELSPYRQEN